MPNRAIPRSRQATPASSASPDHAPSGDVDTAAGPLGPRTPLITEWVDLLGAYGEAGFRMRVWTGFPNRLLTAAQGTRGAAELEAALQAIVLEHNGWRGKDGEPLPPASSERFWWSDEVSLELLGVVQETLKRVPFVYARSLTRTAPRSG